MAASDYSKCLPLSEATQYILVVLEPMHGYAIMQQVEAISEGTMIIGPGTLYGAFSTLEKHGLIAMVKEEARRKSDALIERVRGGAFGALHTQVA